MNIGYEILKPVSDVEEYASVAAWCNSNNAHIEDKGERYEVIENPPPAATEIQATYDRAMEDYLKSVRVARGYTLREPSDYVGSNVPRWAADAADWIAFRDEVLLYGLGILNSALSGAELPSLEDFISGMPVITWSYTE